MKIFIDASGDPGFDPNGSSRYYVAAAVIFLTAPALRGCQLNMDAYAQSVRHRGEFRYSHLSADRRKSALQTALESPWTVALISFDKPGSAWRRPARDGLEFEYQVYRLLLGAIEPMVGAKVYIDGIGGNERELATSVRQALPRGAVKSLRFVDSKKFRAIQLADLVAGAVARSSAVGTATMATLPFANRIIHSRTLTAF